MPSAACRDGGGLFKLADLGDGEPSRPLPGVGHLLWFSAEHCQQVRAMPFRRPTLVRVLHGVKQLSQRERLIDVGAGGFLAIPAGLTLNIGNRPGECGPYRAIVLQFAPELIQRLALAYPELIGDLLRQPAAGRLTGRSTAELDRALQALIAAEPGSSRQQHAAHGVLLVLAEIGYGHLLISRERALPDRVHDLIELQPGFAWTAAEIARRMSMSVATLHRQLRAERQTLTAILQEVRLGYGLSQILTTRRAIADIADECGYASASRFAARFRQRFGVTPSELR